MQLKFRCPTCDRKLRVEAQLASTVVPCPDCGASVTIPEASLGPGTIIGGVLLEQCIGRGGMGEVYVGKQLSMDRRMAIKVLSPALTSNELFVKRFLHETRMAALLEHPNIVATHEGGEDEGVYYLTMAYVDGETISGRMRRIGVIDEAETLSVGLKIAEALAFAWDQFRLLHRDIKPANIMVDTYGEVKLMDMGLAKSVLEDPQLTKTGMAMGTPHYMSPEQARGLLDLDCRSDMYALGGTMYHMLTGKTPFSGTGAVEIITKHALEPLTAPRQLNPALTSRCCALLEALLSKDRDYRHPDWHEVRDDIQRVLDGRTPLLTRSGPHHEVTRSRTHPPSEKAEHLADLAAAELSRRQAQARSGGDGSRAILVIAMLVLVLILGVLVGSFLLKKEPPRVERVPPVTGELTPKPMPAVAAANSPDDRGGTEKPTAVAPGRERTKPSTPPAQNGSTKTDAKGKETAPAKLPEEAPASPVKTLAEAPNPKKTSPAKAAGNAVEETSETSAVKPETNDENGNGEEADRVKLRKLLRNTGKKLLQARFLAAGTLWSEGYGKLLGIPAAELNVIEDQIRAVTGLRQRVLDSFKEDVGHEIMIDFVDGKRRFLVTEITPTCVNGKGLVEHGEISRKITLGDLSRRELVRRLGDDETPEAEMMRAVVVATHSRPGLAFTALAKARSPVAMGMGEALLFSLLRRENPGVRRLRVEMTPMDVPGKLQVAIRCDSGLESVSPLVLVPVVILDLSGSGIEDVASLVKLPLRALNLDGCDGARNLSSVVRMEGIDVLVLSEEASQAARADVTQPMPLNLVKPEEWSAAIRKMVPLPPVE